MLKDGYEFHEDVCVSGDGKFGPVIRYEKNKITITWDWDECEERPDGKLLIADPYTINTVKEASDDDLGKRIAYFINTGKHMS